MPIVIVYSHPTSSRSREGSMWFRVNRQATNAPARLGTTEANVSLPSEWLPRTIFGPNPLAQGQKSSPPLQYQTLRAPALRNFFTPLEY